MRSESFTFTSEAVAARRGSGGDSEAMPDESLLSAPLCWHTPHLPCLDTASPSTDETINFLFPSILI